MQRFALHFAFANNMSKNRAGLSGIRTSRRFRKPAEWKPEGLDLSAGPVPVFPIYSLQRPENCSTLNRHPANLAVPLTCVV